MKHKHHDVIIEWAGGKSIEIWDEEDGWVDCVNPMWNENQKYRVKPKLTVVKTHLYYDYAFGSLAMDNRSKPNTKICFNGLGQLESIEKI